MKINYSNQIQIENEKTTFNNFKILKRDEYLLESRKFIEESKSKPNILIDEINKIGYVPRDEYPTLIEILSQLDSISSIFDSYFDVQKHSNFLLETYGIKEKYFKFKEYSSLISKLIDQNEAIDHDVAHFELTDKFEKYSDKSRALEKEIDEDIYNKMLFLVNDPRKTNKEEKYNLSLYPNMYMELGKVNPSSFTDIIRFSDHFGSFYDRYTPLEYEEEIYTSPIPANYLFYISLDLIKYQIVFKEFIRVLEKPFEDNMQNLIYFFNRFSGYRPTLRIENKKMVPGISTGNLFELAYFQMYIALIESIDFKKCDYCHSYFQIGHKRQRFCPPLPLRKRSSCEMAHHREMKKKQKEGES